MSLKGLFPTILPVCYIILVFVDIDQCDFSVTKIE